MPRASMKSTCVPCILLLILCLSPGSASGAIHQVHLYDTAIVPAQVQILPGDTVRWEVMSGTHQLHSDTDSFKSWDSGPLETPGATYDLPFSAADGQGPFLYLCLWHGHRGTVAWLDSCLATGALGPGGLISVADLVYALRVIAGDVAPPPELYRLDLTGDCVVNAQDAEAISKLFQFGQDSFPVYPVPTCCAPELQTSDCLVSLTGDVDLSNLISASDVIRLVAYVFKGGPPPLPCTAAGDVNCSGSVTSSDVIALVNHIFKSGVLTCDVCDLIPGLWACPE